MRWQIKA